MHLAEALIDHIQTIIDLSSSVPSLKFSRTALIGRIQAGL